MWVGICRIPKSVLQITEPYSSQHAEKITVPAGRDQDLAPGKAVRNATAKAAQFCLPEEIREEQGFEHGERGVLVPGLQ